ncbi:TPA_asm: YRec [Phytophthora water mold MELD virus]|nr:TPA_asm: YRec [Phytophthora water mold MELD virus]
MLTRDDFIKMLTMGKPLSDATIRARSSYLFKLYRDIGNGVDDLSFLNSYSKVIKHVNESESLEARKTKLFHIMSLVDGKAGKNVDATAKKQFRAAATRARNQSMTRTAENYATPDQLAMYVSLDDMTKQLNEGMIRLFTEYWLPMDVKKISADDYEKWDIPSDRKNIKSFARDFQKLLMLACYILQPPLRSDWSTLEITSAAINRLSADQNWIQFLRGGRIRIAMNKFKNVKHMGAQIVEVDSPDLKRYLRYWVDLLARLNGSAPKQLFIWRLSPDKDVKLSTINRESFGKALSRASEGVLSKRQTVNSFRHAYEIALQRDPKYQNMTVAARDRAHGQLLHSHRTGLLYNWQIPDKEE